MKKRVLTVLLVIAVLMAALPASAAGGVVTAVPTASTVMVDGRSVSFDAYNIDGFNYFKLRDLAYTLNASAKQFEVGWSEVDNFILLTSGMPYTVVGGEMTGKGSGSKNAVYTDSVVFLDGEIVLYTTYNIEDNNYFKLRDIGEAFNFGVDWDDGSDMIIISTDKGYTPPDSGATAAPPAATNPAGVSVIDGRDYAELEGIVFTFSSGVGAWATDVVIQPDGTFYGNHYDSDMGDIGLGYPQGTRYYCDFSGKFSPPVKIGEYEYSMKCESLVLENPPGEVEIAGGVRYISSEAYGFDDADVFYLYLPGKSMDDLPIQFIDWVSMPLGIEFEKDDIMYFYGLYNVAGEFGFSGS